MLAARARRRVLGQVPPRLWLRLIRIHCQAEMARANLGRMVAEPRPPAPKPHSQPGPELIEIRLSTASQAHGLSLLDVRKGKYFDSTAHSIHSRQHPFDGITSTVSLELRRLEVLNHF